MKFIKPSLVAGLLVSVCSLYAQSPGGIARQSLWLQGNFFTDSLQGKILNFNPATNLATNSGQVSLPGNIDDLRRSTIFTVYQSAPGSQDRSVWQMTGDFGDLLLSTSQLTSKSEKMDMVFAENTSGSSAPQLPKSVISTYVRRVPAQRTTDAAESNNIVIHFGNSASSQTAGQAPGMIAEFIVYETILKEKEISRVETYLALKYGITLEKNYVNSQGQTIWNRKNAKLYSNNIAGIGRDDQSALYQKQSTSSSAADQLIIGANGIARMNSDNKALLNDGDYLIWGDNNKPFLLDRNKQPNAGDILLSEKKWQMNTAGRSANALSTALKIDTKTLLSGNLPKGALYLVIDRSGTGDFNLKDCSYILPDNISADGIASFSHVLWDTDGSGKDIFTFGVNPGVTANAADNGPKLMSFQVYPNPVTTGQYQVAVSLDKPAEVNIQVYDAHLRLIDSKKLSGQSDYLFNGNIQAAAGVYIVKLLTPGKEFSKILIRQ